jgi:glycosyltransferase involved in cell wall biosynthesis
MRAPQLGPAASSEHFDGRQLSGQSDEFPLVSAIITTYNYARFLPSAIEGALAQTYPNIEVVVIDDGSTDDAAEVAARYHHQGVRYVYQPNAGAAAARNRGLADTRGPLVAFCDADDVWLPNKLEQQYAHLVRHPRVALVTAHAYACDEALCPSSVVHAAKGDCRYVFESLLVRNVVLNPTCVLGRREAFEEIGGFSDLPLWEDWDTWLRLAKRHPIGFVDAPVALVRRHDDSLSPIDGRRRLELDNGIIERHIGDVERAWRRGIIRLRARSNAYFHAATTTAARGETQAARRYAVAALVTDPSLLTKRKLALVARTCLPPRVLVRFRQFAPRTSA